MGLLGFGALGFRVLMLLAIYAFGFEGLKEAEGLLPYLADWGVSRTGTPEDLASRS